MAVNINVPSQVKTYANLAAFPATGALKTIYIAEDTNKTYRWTGSVYVEVSASASGITIGTTAIASGVVGRVLFEGAGNVVQQSSGLSYDDTNKIFQVYNATTTQIRLLTDFSNVQKYAFFQTIASTPTEIGSIANEFGNGMTLSSFNAMYFRPANTERMRLAPTTGNVLIGTTTDAGFRLDVNGTFRATLGQINVGGSHYLTGSVASGTDASLVFRRAADNGWVRYALGAAGTTSFGYDAGTGETQIKTPNFITLLTNNTERIRIFGLSGNVGINTTTDAGFRLDVNGTARVSGVLTCGNNVTAANFIGNIRSDLFLTSNGAFFIFQSSGATGNAKFNQFVSIGTNNEPVASAALDVVSTTKGFLPPRMTTTQKNAIASPATGLQVYDTTLNRPCFYDGTTWITL